MVFAIGSRLPSGATLVTAAAKDRMDAWLDELRAAGIVPTALSCETDGIPDVPATLILVIEGARIAGRKPGRAPFVFEGLSLAQALPLVLARKPDEAELHHVRVFTDAAGHAHFAEELAALGTRFASADVKILNEGVFPYLAATLAQRPGTNLLQGSYAPKSTWLALMKPVGDSSVSGCQREVRQRGSSSVDATEGFLSTLAAVAAARDPQMRVDALSYRNRAMNLQIIAPSAAAIAELQNEIEETRRFSVELEANNPVEGGTEGRLRIVGANP
jgi:hypothetical protein